MNELGNTPADKNYKPSGISRAEEKANKRWPIHPLSILPKEGEHGEIINFDEWLDDYRIWVQSFSLNAGYKEGYEQAEKDIIAIVKEYVEKGFRCMEQSDKFQMHTFWDGFHNCAENILKEMEDRNE